MATKAVNHVCSVFLRQVLRRMKDLGVSHSELAKRMKVSRPYITKLLRHDVNFSFGTAMKLAKALKMDFFPSLTDSETHEPIPELQPSSPKLKKVAML